MSWRRVSRSQTIGVIVASLLLVGTIIVLLTTGGGLRRTRFDDPRGDVVLREGPQPPTDQQLADIRFAGVTYEGDELVFRARMDGELPRRLRGDSSIDWRWEITPSDRDGSWIVSANLDLGPTAAVNAGEGGFGASTVDGTLTADISVEAETLTVRLDPTEVPDFPTEFAWRLLTALDGDRSDPASAVVEDAAPDDGFGELARD